MTLKRALLLSSSTEGVETQFVMQPENKVGMAVHHTSPFTLYQHSSGEWVEICHGTIITEYAETRDEVEKEETILALEGFKIQHQQGTARCTRKIATKQLYENLIPSGY